MFDRTGEAMIELFECVAAAVKEKGVRGLCDMVPGGGYAFDIAGHAYKLYCERRKAAKLREDLEKVAAASAAEAKKVAEEVARKVVNESKDEDLPWALELYLTQIPSAVRQSLTMSQGDPTILVARPISAFLLVIALLILISPVWRGLRRAKMKALAGDAA